MSADGMACSCGRRAAGVEADVHRMLLESTNAIPWKLDWPGLDFA